MKKRLFTTDNSLQYENASDERYFVHGLTAADYFDPDYLEHTIVRLVSRAIWNTPMGYAPDPNYRTVTRDDEIYVSYNEIPARCLFLINE